jgi:hypothetical protein
MTTTPAAATAATALTAVYEAIERDTHNSHISHGGATLTGLAQLVGVLAPLAEDAKLSFDKFTVSAEAAKKALDEIGATLEEDAA